MTEKFSNKIPWSLTKRRGIHTNCRVANSGHLCRIVSTFHMPPDVCFLLHLPPLQHCCCRKRTEAFPRGFWNGDTSKNRVQCASRLLFLLSFGSAYSLPTVYRHSVLNTKAEAKMEKNPLSLITAIASKSWLGLRFSSLPALHVQTPISLEK